MRSRAGMCAPRLRALTLVLIVALSGCDIFREAYYQRTG